MTTEINDGGPAFPHIANWPDKVCNDLNAPGMSLRDWFAGMALSGIQANPKNAQTDITEDSKLAYETADAMLVEREKSK